MHIKSLDVLKLLMAVFIVLFHFHFLKDIAPKTSLFLSETLFRLPVPIFIIISGFFYSQLKDKKKYLKDILLIYAAWSVLYIPYWQLDLRPVKIVEYIFFGYFQLWYLTSIIITFLLFTLFRKSHFICISISVMFFLLNLLIEYGITYDILDFGIYENMARRNIFLVFPYFYIGYLIYHTNAQQYFSIKKASLLLILSILLFLGENLIHIQHAIHYNLDNFVTLPFVSFFLIIFCLKFPEQWNNKKISYFSEKLFLTHGLFLILIFKLPNNETFISLIVLFFSFILSLILYYFKSSHFYKKLVFFKG